MHYTGILDGAGEVWGVRVPDLPGVLGGGATVEAAIGDAISATREWVEAQTADGVAIPLPRPMAEVIADPDVAFVAARETCVLIPLLAETRRSVRANVSIDTGILAAIDAAAKQRGMTRSAFLVVAARALIERSTA